MFSIFAEHLDQKEMLTKVWKLRLKKKEGRCFVSVYKVLNGESKGKYIAAPGLLTREYVPGYITTGSTANAALTECLMKIKNKRFDEIFQKFTTGITHGSTFHEKHRETFDGLEFS